MEKHEKIEFIRKLAQVMRDEKICKLEFAESGFGLKLECNDGCTKCTTTEAVESDVSVTKTYSVRSPMEGTYLSTIDKKKSPAVTLGQRVKVGDTLCLVENGKNINEIASDIDGQIIDIFCKDGDELAPDQVMFKILATGRFGCAI